MLRMRCAHGPEGPFWSERWEPEKLFCELVGLLSEHRRHFVIILFIKLSGPPARPGAPVAGTVRIWLPPVFLASRQHVVNPPMNVSEKAFPLSYTVQKWWKSYITTGVLKRAYDWERGLGRRNRWEALPGGLWDLSRLCDATSGIYGPLVLWDPQQVCGTRVILEQMTESTTVGAKKYVRGLWHLSLQRVECTSLPLNTGWL